MTAAVARVAATVIYGLGLSTAGGLIGAGVPNETSDPTDAEYDLLSGILAVSLQRSAGKAMDAIIDCLRICDPCSRFPSLRRSAG